MDNARLTEIRESIRDMRSRLESGQGTPQSAMCRLSLTMSQELLVALDAATEKALSYDLDAGAISKREADAVELVELRAQVATQYANLKALHDGWLAAAALVMQFRSDHMLSEQRRAIVLMAYEKQRRLLEDFRDNWDCDEDSHKYDTPCRKCEAAKLLAELQQEPQQEDA